MAQCPYFGGCTEQAEKAKIHCGRDSLVFGAKSTGAAMQLEMCVDGRGRMNCRPYLWRRLEKLREKPSSEMTTKTLREMLEAMEPEAISVNCSQLQGKDGISMSEEMTNRAAQTPEYQEAAEITRAIRMNAAVAADAMVEVCKDLKRMRDGKLFEALGYQSFDAYTEDALNIKSRQAYTYISVYERLGETQLQSNANLGITKLALIAEAPATERAGLVEDNDLAGMTARQVEELVKKLKDTGEQLSFLTAERDKLKANSLAAETIRDTNVSLQDQVKELQEQLAAAKDTATTVATAAVDEKEIERLKAEVTEQARKEAEKAAKEKQKAAVDKAISKAAADAAKKAADARAEGEKAGRAAVKASLDAVEREKAAALDRAQQLEKKLSVSSNQETVLVMHLSEELQTVFGKLLQTIEKMESEDAAAAAKFRAATGKLLDVLKKQMEAQ